MFIVSFLNDCFWHSKLDRISRVKTELGVILQVILINIVYIDKMHAFIFLYGAPYTNFVLSKIIMCF